jgi:hypothetical protein
MDITNEALGSAEVEGDGYDLASVEVADTGDRCLVYQIWKTDESVEDPGMDHLASQDELYRVNVVGELENPEEYGENLEPKVSIKQVEGDYYEWFSDVKEEDDAEAFIYGWDETDPRDGDRPYTAAELSPASDPELEDKLSAAYSGVTVGDL